MKQLDYVSILNTLMVHLTVNEETKDGSRGPLIAIQPKKHPYIEVPIKCTAGTVSILFELGNLYVQGFRNKSKKIFIFKDVKYDCSPEMKYTFGTDYGALGVDRNSPIYLSMNDLDFALGDLFNATSDTKQSTIKRAIGRCAIGLSEALRFQDVAMAIMHNREISSLDWARRTADGDYKVRVQHR
ncbi:ribosome-inactivating family protein [Fodinicurvata sp. EGI_FJ10296]|uniref:ribosome-inactivating family protein n=1 Tax=Fodinicurvata sp. EGI_FJ10296 TaxID=3231908 RepID=UPI0034535E4E